MSSVDLCRFYIVRHGQSEANIQQDTEREFEPDLEIAGRLTAKGRGQALALGKKLEKIKIDAIFSSDLIRAVETAEIIRLKRDLAINTTKALRERSYGRMNGRWHLFKHKLQDKIRELAEEDKMSFKFEDVETEEHAVTRLTTFLREIAVAYPGKTVLIACHGNIMRSFLVKLGYGTYHEMGPDSMKNTGHIVVDCDGVDFFLREVNGVSRYKS